MRFLLSAGLLLLLQFPSGRLFAQRRARPRADTPSVVMVPKSQQQVVDTALLLPDEPRKSRRKFRVMVVPATPPGRSRQEVLYSDSLGRMRP